MIDDLDTHIARLREEKGPKWSAAFDSEYGYFRACYVVSVGLAVLGMSPAQVAKGAHVPERIVKQIARHEEGVTAGHINAVSEYLLDQLGRHKLATKRPRGPIGRLEMMVAQRRAEMEFQYVD